MSVTHPSRLHAAFAHAFNKGDLAALLELYAPDAVLYSEPGKPVTGHAAIRSDLAELLAIKGVMKIETVSCAVVGDTALTRGRWTLKGVAPDGSKVDIAAGNLEVLRRQADGSWRMILDDPSGGA